MEVDEIVIMVHVVEEVELQVVLVAHVVELGVVAVV